MTRIKVRNHSPKSLTRAVRECFYGNGHGRYARCGKWEIGLGGYDMGYQIYCNNIAICELKSNLALEMLHSANSTIMYTRHTIEQILNAIKEVEHNTVLVEDED